MPNVLDANGLQTATRQELIDYYTEQFETIYGFDINLESSTPDGQMLGIFVQTVLDLQDLVLQVYNNFDPDNALGRVLDQRVAINGIQRQGGTYTITDVTITLSASANLYGLDQEDEEIYTVADNAGNQFQLITTQLGLGIGAHVLSFQAVDAGEVLTVPNTITVPITVVLEVSAINNPSTYTTLGENEESDAALKVRRQVSVSLASQGYYQGLLAALQNINGVSDAFVYENLTNATDVDGVPGHSIWVIVGGSGLDSEIAEAIYTKRNAGCGMYGSTSYVYTQVDGSPFEIFWDTVLTQNLFIKFTATSINSTNAPDLASIRPGLVTGFVPSVYEEVDITHLGCSVQEIDDNTLVTLAGFTLGETQTATLSLVAASGTFEISYNGNDSAAINWDDDIATINTKVQAVTGLSAAVVTGSIASQSLVFDLSAVGGVQAFIFVKNNSLQDGGATDITFSFDQDFTNTLIPSSKRNQFTLSEANIYILAMQLLPATAQVAVTASKQFFAYGGYGDYTYDFVVNASGGSIDTAGLYTAGGTPGTDTIRVTDVFGNTATSVITVV